jgi:putative NADH-flavin reductase
VAAKRGKRIAVLGASGGVGRRVVDRLLARGAEVVCQTRNAATLADLAGRARARAFDPRDVQALAEFVSGADAVIFALGTDRIGATTLFSEVTAALIPAMRSGSVRRLIAITGVGAGETRGHGGFLYDRVIFPLFTRRRYTDKDRQEALIAESGLDWVIVRPAPFADRAAPGPLRVVTEIRPGTKLTWITRDEVADFVVAQPDSDRYIGQRPFIGHG